MFQFMRRIRAATAILYKFDMSNLYGLHDLLHETYVSFRFSFPHPSPLHCYKLPRTTRSLNGRASRRKQGQDRSIGNAPKPYEAYGPDGSPPDSPDTVMPYQDGGCSYVPQYSAVVLREVSPTSSDSSLSCGCCFPVSIVSSGVYDL